MGVILFPVCNVKPGTVLMTET